MRTYEVTFDRIGRRHDVPPLTLERSERDPLGVDAGDVWRYARRFLGSKEFEVSVFEDGDVLIEGGRFGSGRWVER